MRDLGAELSAGTLETRRVTTLRAHPRAAIVPEMNEERFAGFLEDVRDVGIVTPLDILDDGTVLDGRHRLKAARAIGLSILPVRVLVLGEDPVEYIFRAATQRRDLTADQRAFMGLEMDRYRAAREAAERDAAENRRANAARANEGRAAEAKRGPGVATLPPRAHAPAPRPAPKAPEAAKTRDVVAAAVNVSPRTVQNAIAVQKAAETSPAVAAMLPKIRAGEVSTGDALKLVKLEKKPAMRRRWAGEG